MDAYVIKQSFSAGGAKYQLLLTDNFDEVATYAKSLISDDFKGFVSQTPVHIDGAINITREIYERLTGKSNG